MIVTDNGGPDQEILRRRLKAARALHDLTLAQLAARIPASYKLGERTLRRLENGETEITLRHIAPIAAAMKMPDAWFTTEGEVWASLEVKTTASRPSESVEPNVAEELMELKARMQEIERRIGLHRLNSADPPAGATSDGEAEGRHPQRTPTRDPTRP